MTQTDKKTATVRARIEPKLKKEAESILESLGLTTTQAITVFFRQVTLQKGMPFDVVIPKEKSQKKTVKKASTVSQKTTTKKETPKKEEEKGGFRLFGMGKKK